MILQPSCPQGGIVALCHADATTMQNFAGKAQCRVRHRMKQSAVCICLEAPVNLCDLLSLKIGVRL